MTSHDLDALRRLEPARRWLEELVARGGETVPVGPFLALFHTDLLGFNHAVPTEPLRPEEVPGAVAKLRRLFAERGLELQFELNEPLFPNLPALLEREGLTLTEREPLLLLTPGDFRPVANPKVDVRFLGEDAGQADLIAYRSIFNEVLLEKPLPPSAESIAALRREIAQLGGRSHALARLEGRPVGTGFISSADGVCELARVGTTPDARRKGVAATVTSFMISDRFGRGDTLAWLTAMAEPARILYLKLGFRLLGDRLYYRDRPATTPASGTIPR